MKIKYMTEPKLSLPGDLAYTIIEEFSKCKNDQSVIECTKKWKTLDLGGSTQLSDWADVLNKLDALVEAILVKESAMFHMSHEYRNSSSVELSPTELNMSNLWDILTFTSKLLSCSFSKDVYNSTEKLLLILTCYDIEYVFLAMECLYYLTLPPPGHRCDCYLGKHSTQLHKNPIYLLMMFEVVEASFFEENFHEFIEKFDESNSTTVDNVRGRYQKLVIDHERRFYLRKSVFHEIFTQLKYVSNVLPSGSLNAKEDLSNLHRVTIPQNLIEKRFVVDNIFDESIALPQVIESSKSILTYEQQCALLFSSQMRRCLLSKEKRLSLVKFRFQAVAILLTSYPDTTSLLSFFQNKLTLLQDFLYLISNGFVNSESNEMEVDSEVPEQGIVLQIRQIACHCLSAAVETRDHHSTNIFTQYPWLLHELGVNRGQYMGLFPGIIRNAASFLHEIYSKHTKISTVCDRIDDSLQNTNDDVVSLTKLEEQRIHFVEYVLIFLSSLINLHTTIPALNENGVMSALLSIIKDGTGEGLNLASSGDQDPLIMSTGLRRQYPVLLYIDSLALEIIESMLNAQQPSLILFREEQGLEVVVNRLAFESQTAIYCAYKRAGITMTSALFKSPQTAVLLNDGVVSGIATANNTVKLNTAENIMIQVLFSIIGTFLQELRGDYNNNDFLQTTLARNPAFIESLDTLLTHSQSMASIIVSALISLVAEIINKDAAPPTILNTFLHSNLVEKILNILSTNPHTIKHDLPLTLLGFVSAISLTKEGSDFVMNSSIFSQIIQLFHCPFQYLPHSKTFFYDLPVNLGNGFEELIRHYPIYLEKIMEAVNVECKQICNLGELCIANQHAVILPLQSNVQEVLPGNYSCSFNTEYFQNMQYVISLLTCLEGLFTRKPCIEYFLEHDGFDYLFRIRGLSLGSPRYLLTALACMIDSTVHSIGYSSIETLLHRLIQLILGSDSKKIVLIQCVKYLQLLPGQIEIILKNYWNNYGEQLLSKLSPPLVNLSFPYLKAFDTEGTISKCFYRLLDTLSREPLQQYSDVGTLPAQLIAMTNVFRGITMFDYVIELFGLCINPKYNRSITSIASLNLSSYVTGNTQNNNSSQLRTSMTEMELITSELKSAPIISLLQNLLEQFYVPTQFEMTRTRGSFITATTQSDCVKVHPIYVLLVVSDTIVIKDSLEDGNSKKIGKLSKGTILYAYERRTNSSNILKYHLFEDPVLYDGNWKLPGDNPGQQLEWSSHQTSFSPSNVAGGWVGVYRNVTNADPQVIVVDILHKPLKIFEEEYTYNTKSLLTTSQKKFEFEKFANISSRRGGFLSLFHLHYSMKMNLLGGLSRLLYTKDSGPSNISSFLPSFLDHNNNSKGIVIRELANNVLPLFEKTLVALSPIVRHNSAHISEDAAKSSAKTAHASFFLKVENVTKLDPTDLANFKTFLEESYICTSADPKNPFSIPFIEDFGTDKVYLAIRVMELAQTMFFDVGTNSRSKHHASSNKSHPVEANILFLLQSLYSDDIGVFEKMLEGTYNVFLTAFHPFDANVSSTSSGFYFKQQVVAHMDNSLFAGSDIPPAWHDFTDEYLDFFYDEQLSLQQKNDANESSSQWLLFQKYREYRLAVRERRLLAFSSLEGIIDVWRQCLNFINTHTPPTTSSYQGSNTIGSNLSGIEKAFVKYLSSNSENYGRCYYHPELFKRYLYFVIMKYLLPVFCHPLLRVLPPTLVKNIVDLLNLSIKVGQEIKTWYIKTPSRYYVAESNSSDSTSMETTDRTTGAAPLASRRTLRNATASAAYLPSEETVVALIDMGFERADIVRAITAHRTNNIMQLVSILIENPPPPSPAYSSAPSTERANADANLSTASNNIQNSADNLSQMIQQDLPSFAQESDISPADNAMRSLLSSLLRDGNNTSSSNQNATSIPSFLLSLPLVPVYSEEELSIEKAFVHKMAVYLQNIAPVIFFSLIEHGPASMADLMDLDMYNQNISITKEVFTMQLMTQMLKLFDGYSFTEQMVLSIQVIAFYKESLRIMEPTNESIASSVMSNAVSVPSKTKFFYDETKHRLGGLLHSIIVLLSSKIVNLPNGSYPQRGNNATTSCELIQFLIRQDDRYSSFHTRLLNVLEETLLTPNSPSNFFDYEPFELSWIAPAILLLDMIHQAFLVDHETIKTTIREMEYRFANGNRSLDYISSGISKNRNSSRVLGLSIDDMIPPEMRTAVKSFSKSSTAKISDPLKDSPKEEEKNDEIDRLASLHSPEASQSQSLPLLSSGLTLTQQIQLANICTRLLSLVSNTVDVNSSLQEKVNDILRAALQTLIHLQSHETVRQIIQDLKCPLIALQLPYSAFISNATSVSDSSNILEILSKVLGKPNVKEKKSSNIVVSTNLEGIPNMVFTLIQRQFEDEIYLMQSMTAAMKLIFEKLCKELDLSQKPNIGSSKDQHKKVPLKNFLELACPLLYRNQQVFLQLISLRFEVKSLNGTLMMYQRETINGDGKMDDEKNGVGDGNLSMVTGSPTPIKKLKSNEYQSVVTKSEVPELSSAPNSSLSTVKRKIYPSDPAAQSSSSNIVRSARNIAAQEIVEELCEQIVKKWLFLQRIFSSCAGQLGDGSFNSYLGLSITELLYTLSDLIAAIPAFSTYVCRYRVRQAQAVDFVYSLMNSRVPGIAKTSSISFPSFVLNGLMLLPQKHQIFSENSSGVVFGLSNKDMDVLYSHLEGASLHDSCYYLFASILSRPNDNRKYLLQELNSLFDLKDPVAFMQTAVNVNATMQHCNLVQSLFCPPANWLQRDSFVLPVKDISQAVFQSGLPKKIIDIFSKISIYHPQCNEFLATTSSPIDTMIRRAQQFSLSFYKELKIKSQSLESAKKPKRSGGAMSNIEHTLASGGHVSESYSRQRRGTEGSDHSEYLDDGLLLSGGERRLSQAYQDHLVISQEDHMMFNNEQDDNSSVAGDVMQQDEEDDDGGETSDLEPRPHDEDEDRDEDDEDDDILEEIHVEEDDEDEDSDNHEEDDDSDSDNDDDDDEPDHRDRSRPHSGEHEGVDEDSHADNHSDNDEDDEMIVDVGEDDDEDNNEDEDVESDDEGSSDGFGGRRVVANNNAEGFYEEHDDNIDNNLHTEGVDAMEADDDGDEELDDIDDEVDINANSPGNAYLEDGEDIEQMMSNALGLSTGGHADWTIGGLRRSNVGNRRSSLREGLHNGRHHRQSVAGSATGATNFAGQILGELLGEDILANNPLISIIDGNEVRVRIDAPRLSRIPIGASLISSGRGGHGIDPASIFHQIAFEGNGDVMGASVPITTSSARIDPRTGALTLSFDGRGSNRSVTAGSPLNVVSLQPPLHPLLSVMDARRGRLINHASGSGLGSLIAGSFGVPLGRNDPYYVTDARSNNNNSRSNRSSVNPRKSMGPLVSNRRWGADIGEIESPDSRVSTLTQRVGKCLHETLGSIPDTNEDSDNKLKSESSKEMSREEAGHMFLENLASGLRSYFGNNTLETTANRTRTNDPFLEESKEEGELQESKEDDEPSATDMNVANIQPSVPLQSLSNDVSPTNNIEENHDDGGGDDDGNDDDDDEDDDDSSATSSNSSNSNDEMDVDEEEPVPIENLDNNDNANNSTTNAPSTTVEVDGIPVSAVDNNINQVELSVENLEFLDSLPPDLRQEVLLAAEEQFLLSLPLDVQHEARLLREQQIIEEQVFSYARNQNQNQISRPSDTTTTSVAAVNVDGNTATSSNSTSSQRPDNIAQPPKVDENPLPDQACYISVVGNIECETKFVPFNAPFMLRIFEWLLKCKSERIPSNLLRLLIAAVKYDATRKEMLQCLFHLLLKNDVLVKRSIVALESKTICEGESRSLEDELVILTTLNTTGSSSLHYRKLLAVIGFLLKKTDSLVWYDIMATPVEVHSEFPWLFGCVIQLLSKIVDESPIDLESILHMLEKLCSPFSKLSVTQINKLVNYSTTTIGEVTTGEIKSNVEESAVATASKEGTSEQTKEDGITTTKKSRLMPFPKLSVADAKILSNVVSTCDCSSGSRKALMRVLRYISLSDDNWNLLLNELALVGMNLILKTTVEFQNLHNSLLESLQNEENVVMVMSKPALSNFQVLWEVRLLNILRLMTVLRSRSGSAASTEADIVSQYMSQIQGGKLWDMLSDCLDIVRELEGIQSIEGADEASSSSSAAGNRANVNPLQTKFEKSSMLTMRFIPLIECFLTVCAKTMLVRPAEVTHNAAATELTRVNSMLPGSRFRQSSNFLQMHMELQDEISSKQLLRFAEQNAVLLNIILRHNVHLLESSFAPLVTVPKCRMLLHFDIKRSYFKSKLKRMRQSISRHGSLRIAVRRQRIFEESFQQLRHKSADDMRRRLSVTFHNEEGMDAGGLTREWYSVLAREIFNANYALFCCTGDNVTFQPNPHSYVNPEHLSYFKFVGRVIGKAICDDQLLDAHFTRSFYKHILGLPVNIQDLEAIEPEYYKSLVQILETPLDLLGLELTFSAEANEFGHISIIDLIPNGREVAVTDDTKHEYVKLIAHHRMTSAIRKQIDAFLEGFHELVPAELISIFDAQELELLISGLPEIDLDDLRGNADYHGYKASDPIINQFWNILKSFSKEEKALFLQFVTGTSKVPLDGFKALQGADGIKRFNIHKAFGSTSILPTAHTCFNQLDLPEYPSEEIMREKLLISIREGSEGFGFA